jgi:hypothetical protein
MNDVSIESRRKSRAFRAPALFYFMVVMRAALQQNINHVKVPQFFFSFSRVSQTLDVIPSIIRPVVGHPRRHRAPLVHGMVRVPEIGCCFIVFVTMQRGFASSGTVG